MREQKLKNIMQENFPEMKKELKSCSERAHNVSKNPT